MSRRGAARTQPYVGLAAAPDTNSINRLMALQGFAAANMSGRNAHVVGVDRGDPTRSLTGPLNASPSPTTAVAAVSSGDRAGYRPQAVIQDNALTNPELDPYNALLLARMRDRR